MLSIILIRNYMRGFKKKAQHEILRFFHFVCGMLWELPKCAWRWTGNRPARHFPVRRPIQDDDLTDGSCDFLQSRSDEQFDVGCWSREKRTGACLYCLLNSSSSFSSAVCLGRNTVSWLPEINNRLTVNSQGCWLRTDGLFKVRPSFTSGWRSVIKEKCKQKSAAQMWAARERSVACEATCGCACVPRDHNFLSRDALFPCQSSLWCILKTEINWLRAVVLPLIC